MQNLITPSSPELIAADKALRRAAISAKKLAEQQGTPYVVAEKTLPLLNSGGLITSNNKKKIA